MKKGIRYARDVGTHVLVNGHLAQVKKRDSISGFHMIKVVYHNPPDTLPSCQWITVDRGYPVP